MNNMEMIDRKKAISLVEEMNVRELMTFIKQRLKRESIVPPLNTSSDERPEYFLEKMYETSNNDSFKSKFRKSIAELLKDQLNETYDHDYLAMLLLFCEQYIIAEAIEPIAGMALSGRLKGIQSIEGELHRRVLMALSRLPEGLKMTDIWEKSMRDPHYTSVAFAAFMSQGLDTICKYLPEFFRLNKVYPDCLNLELSLLNLYEEFKKEYPIKDEITRKIQDCFINVEPEIFEIFIRVMNLIGVNLSYNPIVTGENRENIILDLKKLKNNIYKRLTVDGVKKEVYNLLKPVLDSIRQVILKQGNLNSGTT